MSTSAYAIIFFGAEVESAKHLTYEEQCAIEESECDGLIGLQSLDMGFRHVVFVVKTERSVSWDHRTLLLPQGLPKPLEYLTQLDGFCNRFNLKPIETFDWRIAVCWN